MGKRYLSEATHNLADRALSGEWSKSICDAKLNLEDIDGIEEASETRKYAECVRLITQKAPLRIILGERIVGSATLKLAVMQRLPVYRKGKPAFLGTSHLTPGFNQVLKIGYKGLYKQIEERLNRGDLYSKGIDLLNSMKICLDAATIWHRRYMKLLDKLIADSEGAVKENYERVRENLRNVPKNPPASFYEAVQSLWFMFTFQRLCGNWPAIGRIDEILGTYLKNDLRQGRITIDEAREILAHFWIRGTEWAWIGADAFKGSGDAQHYQNIILSGVNQEEKDVTNEVTYLVLDIVEELHINDFPIAIRINSNTDEKLVRRIAEVQRLGGGIVSVYNEDLVIKSLVEFGYPIEEARCFANDGCWEVQIPGKTNFNYEPFDVLSLLQETIGVTDFSQIPDFENFEDLYSDFYNRLERHFLEDFHTFADSWALDGPPSPLIALFVKDCIEKARDYRDRGTKYTVYAPHAGGIPDTGNSLLAIKKVVFEERLIGFKEFVRCLRNNWKGYEDLRQYILNKITFYGNGDLEADSMTKRVLDDFVKINSKVHYRNGVLRPMGVSSFAGNVRWRYTRKATADGHRTGEFFGATNFSPSPGTDKEGPTAAIQSYCSMDLKRITNGTSLELKIPPVTVKGKNGIRGLVGLMKGFVKLGGFFMQVDVIDNKVLLDAQKNSEKYKNLVVRVAGWSAHFITLSKEYQDMVINRTQQKI